MFLMAGKTRWEITLKISRGSLFLNLLQRMDCPTADCIAICKLTGADVVRHELVQKIIEAYEKDEKRRAPQQKLDPAKFKRKK